MTAAAAAAALKGMVTNPGIKSPDSCQETKVDWDASVKRPITNYSQLVTYAYARITGLPKLPYLDLRT